jgi:hypothetical protein
VGGPPPNSAAFPDNERAASAAFAVKISIAGRQTSGNSQQLCRFLAGGAVKIPSGPFTHDRDARKPTRGRREIPDKGRAAPDEPLCWLEWGRKRFPLTAGEHIAGRDSEAAIKLDVSTISRRHARFVVTIEGTVIEDLSSKNGTFRGGERIKSPVLLADGDAIRLGSLLVTYHAREPLALTDTHAETIS